MQFKNNIMLLCIFLCLCTSCSKKKNTIHPQDHTDLYFGVSIHDPYRFIEDTKNKTVKDWIDKKNNEGVKIFKSIANRDKLLDSINNKKNSSSISKINVMSKGYLFYLKKDSKINNAKLFYKKTTEDEKETLLYNPQDFKKETGKNYLINYIKPSWDGSKVLVSLTESDKEISEMIIIDVSSKKVYPQILDHCWPSALGGVKWLPDNSGFIYVYLPVIDTKSKKYLFNSAAVLHKIEDRENKIKPLFSKANNPDIKIQEVDFCEIEIEDPHSQYIYSHVSGATQFTDCYYSDIKQARMGNIKWKPLFKTEDQITRFVQNNDDMIYMTSKDAPNFKICKISLTSPDVSSPTLLVPQDSNAKITDIAITNKGVFFVKTKNGVDAKLFRLHKNGDVEKINLPKAAGYINVSSIGAKYDDLWIEIKGWTSKKERFKYNFKTNIFEKENLSSVSTTNKNFEDIVIEEIEIPSHDGVMIPLSIIYKKGIQQNGNNRVLMNAYGSYGRSNSPYPYSYLLHWVEKGGIYAVAHVRGGGEKGEKWRKAGYKNTKPNTWKDLISCTEYLINKKYTSSSKIALWGASAGGICIGRAITERPDLYAAAIIKVGSLNTLRAEHGTNGANNIGEFGTVKDSLEFKSLLKMDSYHSIQENTAYPALYLVAGLNDARIPAWHTTKFAAKIENATSSDNPILMFIDPEGGHGFNKTQLKKNEELANIISFALWQTGHTDYQLK